MFSYGFSNNTSEEFGSYSSGSVYERNSTTNRKSYNVGVMVFAGLEGKINDNIGFFTEVDLTGGKSWIDTEHEFAQRIDDGEESKSFSDTSENRWFYQLSRVKLGVYFLL